MADKNIGSLPAAEALDDESLLLTEQQGEARHFKGKLLKDYARQGVDALVSAAQEAATKAAQAAQDAQAAADGVKDVTADTEAAKAAAQAAENARAAAVQAAQAAEQAARLAADAAAIKAVQSVEDKLVGYVSDAESAKTAAQSAAGAAAQEAVSAVGPEMAGYVSAAQAAQKAAEQARDEAQGIAGGDFASTAYVDNKASEAESNAKKYTDEKIAAISTPDVSGQIGTHNTDTSAHSDIRKVANDAASVAATAQGRANEAYSLAENKQNKITGTPGQIVGFDENRNPVAQEAPSGGGGTIDENLVLITLADIDEICNPAPVIPPNTFQKVRAFTSGKEYILLFGYNGAFYCLSNEAHNDWTVKAAAVPEVTSTDAQITFATVPTLFTAMASGSGFTLSNGSNSITGSASSGGTSLKVNADAGTVFTVDTSEMGGFDSDEIVAKVDEQAVWLRAALNSQSYCLKFESGNTSIGIDYKDRDATYSTGFLSFVLYEKIS